MKIYVENEEQRWGLLEESKYIHDFLEDAGGRWIGLDPNKANTLMHIHINPNIIVVKEQVKLGLSDIMDLLSNDIIYEESERKGARVDDDGMLKEDTIYTTAFEMGMLHARKLLINYLKK